MSLEFLLGLVVLVAFVFLAVWVYARVFDFADEWKRKARLKDQNDTLEFLGTLAEGPRSPLESQVEARLPPMTYHDYDPGWEIGSRYGIDYEPPSGPPDGWERHPPRSKAGRILD